MKASKEEKKKSPVKAVLLSVVDSGPIVKMETRACTFILPSHVNCSLTVSTGKSVCTSIHSASLTQGEDISFFVASSTTLFLLIHVHVHVHAWTGTYAV